MKKLNWILGSLMLCGVFFAACSKDDGGDGWKGPSASVDCDAYDAWTYFRFEDGKTVKTVKVTSTTGGVPGMYTGDFDVKVMGSSYGTIADAGINITEVSDDKVLVTLDSVELNMNGKSMGKCAFSVESKVEKGETEWTLLAGDPVTIECGNLTLNEFTLSGTIGVSPDSEANINISFKPGSMPMPIMLVYTSKTRINKIYSLAESEDGFDWDIAFHRYEIKTNGGSAVMLNTVDLNSVSATTVAGETFVEDGEGSVMVDMTNMMQGFVGYQATNVNEVLGKWVTATPTGTMPPYTYTLNSNVFVVRMKDGKMAKVQFTDMSDATGKKEMASFNYEYPLQ